MNYAREIKKLRADIARANQQEEEARMTRYFAYARIAELQAAARIPAERYGPMPVDNLTPKLSPGEEG